MTGATPLNVNVGIAPGAARHSAVTEPKLVRALLIGTALVFLGLFLFVPLAAVWHEALKKGFGPYFAALSDPDTVSAIVLTLTVAVVTVPLNLIFGIAAAWAIAR